MQQTRLTAVFAPRDERRQVSGGYIGGVTPVPIPNTEVKPSRADGTARATAWESRSLPDAFMKPPRRLFWHLGASLLRAWLAPEPALSREALPRLDMPGDELIPLIEEYCYEDCAALKRKSHLVRGHLADRKPADCPPPEVGGGSARDPAAVRVRLSGTAAVQVALPRHGAGGVLSGFLNSSTRSPRRGLRVDRALRAGLELAGRLAADRELRLSSEGWRRCWAASRGCR